MSTVLTPLTTYRGSIHGPSTAADHDTSQQRNFPTTITSLNVNGMFTDEDKQRRVADTISGSGAMLAANYVLIQEVKANHRDEALDIDACKTLASNVNPGGRCWITPYCMTMASPHDDATEVEAYSALNGRVIILHAEGMRIVNLYAPAEHKERRMFYNLLRRAAIQRDIALARCLYPLHLRAAQRRAYEPEPEPEETDSTASHAPFTPTATSEDDETEDEGDGLRRPVRLTPKPAERSEANRRWAHEPEPEPEETDSTANRAPFTPAAEY